MLYFFFAGMSTAHEVTVGRHMAMRVFGLSLITNIAVTNYDRVDALCHEEVLGICKERSGVMREVICDVIRQM